MSSHVVDQRANYFNLQVNVSDDRQSKIIAEQQTTIDQLTGKVNGQERLITMLTSYRTKSRRDGNTTAKTKPNDGNAINNEDMFNLLSAGKENIY